MKSQVNKNSYSFKKYCDQDRWLSYWHQVDEIISLSPENILEIGVGDRFLSNYIKNNTSIDYKNLDIAEDLNPDIVASVEDIPFKKDSFDLVCAFEVLEHLPFEKFEKCLKELQRVVKNKVIISLPHWGRHFSIDIRLPYLKRFRWQYKFGFLPIEHNFDGQHYWEIGKRGYSLKKIRSLIKSSGFEIEKDYIAFNSPYHHFFILNKQ